MTDSEYNEQPVFQVTFVEKLARRSNDRTDIARYRLHLSDGLKFCMFTSLAQSVNDMVSDGRITLYSVIRLIKYRTHLVKMANCIEMLKVLDVYGVVVLCGNQDKINGDALKYWQPEFCAAEVVTPLIFTDIDALTPELPKWYVKARVTARSEVYTTNDGRDWYKVDLLDKKGGAIHCTVFSEQFDRMKNVLVVSKKTLFPSN